MPICVRGVNGECCAAPICVRGVNGKFLNKTPAVIMQSRAVHMEELSNGQYLNTNRFKYINDYTCVFENVFINT